MLIQNKTWINTLLSFHGSCAALAAKVSSHLDCWANREDRGKLFPISPFPAVSRNVWQLICTRRRSKNETQLARRRGRCSFTTWNQLKSIWQGKSYFGRKPSPLTDLTALRTTAVWNMTFKGHISSSLQRCLITAMVGKHKVNLSVIKEEKKNTKIYSQAMTGAEWVVVTLMCLFEGGGAFLSSLCLHGILSSSPLTFLVVQQKSMAPYSEEGLMSTNEILSAMSHSSEGCWDDRRAGPMTLQRLLWSPKHQHSHWLHTNLWLAVQCTLSGNEEKQHSWKKCWHSALK